MKKYIALFVVLCLLLSAAGCAAKPADSGAPADTGSGAADTSLADLKASGKLRQGMDDAFPPMGFRDTSDQLVGFDVDIAKEVAARLGVELVPTPINWTQKENELNTGSIDAIWNGFTITDERIEKTEMTFAYMKNRQVLVVLASSPYNTPADLAGKKLALQAESTAEDALNGATEFKASLDGGEAIKFDDNMKALMDLDVGGCDCVLMDEIVANYYITQGSSYRVLDEALADEEYGIGFKKGNASLKAEVESILKAMKADGTLEKISIKWFGKDVTTVP